MTSVTVMMISGLSVVLGCGLINTVYSDNENHIWINGNSSLNSDIFAGDVEYQGIAISPQPDIAGYRKLRHEHVATVLAM